MNWGKGIIGGMIVFMLFIIGMSVKMFSIPDDDFDKQYYEKGLTYDKEQAREQQVFDDLAKPVVSLNNRRITLTFAAPAHGIVKLIRPSNKALDKEFKINTSKDNTMAISENEIPTGLWHLVLEWESDGKPYTYMQELFIK